MLANDPALAPLPSPWVNRVLSLGLSLFSMLCEEKTKYFSKRVFGQDSVGVL